MVVPTATSFTRHRNLNANAFHEKSNAHSYAAGDTRNELTLLKYILVLRITNGQRSFRARAHYELESHRSRNRSDE